MGKKKDASQWGLQHHLFLVVVIARASRGLWWRCSNSINKRLLAKWLCVLKDIRKDDKYSTYLNHTQWLVTASTVKLKWIL